ncbi:MAG: Fic family protein [Pseudomonadota bacterium]
MKKWIQRDLLILPEWNELCEASRQALRETDEVFRRIHEVSLNRIDAGLDQALDPPLRFERGIHHALSCKFPPVKQAIELTYARREFAALRATYRAFEDSLSGGLGLAASKAAGADGYRVSGVATSADPKGRFVVFPEAELIAAQLQALDQLLRASKDSPHAYRAMIGLVAITNCHPFSDGNGRVGRIFYNVELAQGAGRPVAYIPLREFAQFSRGGYLIRVRQAEVRQEWAPLAQFLLSISRVWLMCLRRDQPVVDEMRAGATLER